MVNINYLSLTAPEGVEYIHKCSFCCFGNVLSDDGNLEKWITCSSCRNLFHDTCRKIEIGETYFYDGDAWYCKLCRNNQLASHKTETILEEVGEFPVGIEEYLNIGTFLFEYVIKNRAHAIPMIRDFNAQDMFKFFQLLNLQKEGAVFLKQEMDGISFLLLTQEEVFKSFGFKVGPALKVYNHLQILRWKMLH